MSNGGPPDDGSIDPCDCYAINHFGAMQRLIEMVRQGQSACNDRECLIDNPMQPSTSSNSTYSSGDLQVMFIFGVWIMLMTAMFLFWPRNRSSSNTIKRTKSALNDNGNGNNNTPPPPPPSATN